MAIVPDIIVRWQPNLPFILPPQFFPGRREDQRDRMYNRECNGDNEHHARFRFGRPDGDVYPHSRDTPDDVLSDNNHDKTDKVYEKKDAKSGPLMVRVLIRLARFPRVTKFNAGGRVHVRFSVVAVAALTRVNMGT